MTQSRCFALLLLSTIKTYIDPVSLRTGLVVASLLGTTFGEAFQQAGYETAFYGKWHMGNFEKTGGPVNHGYESQKAVVEANRCSMFYPFRGVEYFPEAKEGDNYTDLLTDAAIDFVSQKRDKPFYLHLAHFAMHAPIESKPDLRDKFEKKAALLPPLPEEGQLDDYAHKPYKLRQDEPEYAGELATLDANIGRLIQALKEADIYDNTIVVFTGDNGGRSAFFRSPPTSNEPLRAGKTFLFEGGIRTPTLMHWPGRTRPGMSSSIPIASMDFFPTLLEMAGLPALPNQHIDGVSLVPLIDGKPIDREALYWHFPHYQGEGSYPASAIRIGDYKLIHNYHHDNILLYNIANDPGETEDLARRMPERAKAMDRKLISYLKATGAHIPQAIPIEK